MSFSEPQFTTNRTGYKKQMVTILDDTAFADLHWTEQLKRRPLGEQKRYEYNRDGDFDTRLDNWDDNEILDKETT